MRVRSILTLLVGGLFSDFLVNAQSAHYACIATKASMLSAFEKNKNLSNCAVSNIKLRPPVNTKIYGSYANWFPPCRGTIKCGGSRKVAGCVQWGYSASVGIKTTSYSYLKYHKIKCHY